MATQAVEMIFLKCLWKGCLASSGICSTCAPDSSPLCCQAAPTAGKN